MADFSDFFGPELYANPQVDRFLRNGATSLATLPQRAIENSQYSLDSGNYDPAPTLEAATLPMGLAAPAAETGAAGIFGGRLAQTADLNALQRAEALATKGAGNRRIWNETGWFRGDDGQWRFEISDHNSRMNPHTYSDPYSMPTGNTGPIAGQIWHPDLYQAYPDLRTATAHVERSPNLSGAYLSRNGGETLNAQAPTPDDAWSVLLHELQHAVQNREGFQGGGNVQMFSQADDAKLARDVLSYRREIAGLDPHLTPLQKDEIVNRRYQELGAANWLPSTEARNMAHELLANPQQENTLRAAVQLYGLDKRVKPLDPLQIYRELPGEIEARNVQTRRNFTPEMRKNTAPWWSQDVQPRPIVKQLFRGAGAQQQHSWSDFR